MVRNIKIKRIILILLMATVVICIAGISNSYGATVTGTVTAAEGVNVRTEPDTSKNNIIMAIQYNSKVDILGEAQGSGYNWYKVRYNGKTGYAVADFIAKDSSGSHETGDFTNTYGTVNSDIGVNVRSGPGTGYKIIDGLFDGTEVKVNGKTTDSNGDIWYEIVCSAGKGYVFGEYLILKEVKPYEPNADFEQHLSNQGFPESYKEILRKVYANHSNWIFIADHTGLDWKTVIDKENGYSGKTKFNVVGSWFPSEFIAERIPGETDYGAGWAPASRYAIEYYMDPRNFIDSKAIFQFMSSKYDPSIQNKSGVDSIISGSFMVGKSPGYDANDNYYSSYADVIMAAAKESGVSAYMISSMIINEQSRYGSPASLGTVKGYEGYYNFFNIGATDGGDPNLKGAIYAKNQGWDTPAKSIIGGAIWFGNDYINNNQYTPYLKKFNVMNGIGNVPYHQYMTNVSGAWQEGNTQAEAYLKMGDIPIIFNIPVYKNMPNDVAKPPEPSKPSIKPGWNKDSTGWWYQNSDGSYAKGWKYIDNEWYYFSNVGYMETGWQKIDGKDYYLYGDGHMASNERTPDGYYVNKSGVWIKDEWKQNSIGWWYQYGDGTYAIGLTKISGKKYYFNNSGYMETGWKYIDGKWYYFNTIGYMETGWLKIDGKHYYLYEDGHMASNERTPDGYYVNKSGVWIKDEWKQNSIGWWYQYGDGTYAIGLTEISGKKYYFNNSGYMQTGWIYIDGEWCYFNSIGYMVKGWR